MLTSNTRWNRRLITFITCCIVATISGVAALHSTSASSIPIPVIPVHHWSRSFTAPSYTRLPLIRGAVATLGDAASDFNTVLGVVNRRQPRTLISSPSFDSSSSSSSSEIHAQKKPAAAAARPLPPVRKRIRSRTPHRRRTNSTARHRLHTMSSNVANGSPLVGCASLDFSIPVMLGMSGNTVFQLLFDTGSSTLALAGSTCTTCSSAGVSPLYTASGATVGTASSSYGDGSGWSGNVYSDTVKVVGSSSNTGITPAVTMNVASMTDQTNSFFSAGTCSDPNSNSSPWQGIIGFAYQSLATGNTDSFPHKLIQQTTGTSSPYANEFYVEMCVNDGALWFSGMSLASYSGQFHYVPISDQTYYQVVVTTVSVGSTVVDSGLSSSQSIVDSGTSLWSLPTTTYNSAVSQINSNSQFSSWFGSQFWSASSCSNTPNGQTIASMNAALPTLSVTFGNGVVASLPAIGSYLIPCDSTLTSWQSGIGDSGDTSMTMGWSFMNNFVVHHDIGNSRIGFAVATGCSPMYTSTGSGATVTGNPSGPVGTGVGGASGSASSTGASSTTSGSGSSSTAGGAAGGGGSASSSATSATSASTAATASGTTGSSTTGGSSSTTTDSSSSTASASSTNPTSDGSSSVSSSGSAATSSDPSTSSPGTPSSTSTGGSTSSLPSDATISATFPFICTNLRLNNLPDVSAQYDILSNVGNDIAAAVGVAASRILVVSVHNLDSSTTQVRFTLADALVSSQPTTTDVATRFINSLSRTENPYTDKTSYPYLQYATVSGTHICSDSSELTSLPVVQFGISYSIDSLPGGSVLSFADQVRSSLAEVCATTPNRIIINSVVAGSVQVTFVVSDSKMDASDVSSQQAVNNFMNRIGSNDAPSSSTSGVLSQASPNSARLSSVGTAIANANQLGTADSSSSSSNTTPIIIIAVAIGGGVILVIAICWILYAYCCKSAPQHNHESAKVQPQHPGYLSQHHHHPTSQQQRIGFGTASNGMVHPSDPRTYAVAMQSQQQRAHLGGPPTLSHGNVQVLVAPPVLVQHQY